MEMVDEQLFQKMYVCLRHFLIYMYYSGYVIYVFFLCWVDFFKLDIDVN